MSPVLRLPAELRICVYNLAVEYITVELVAHSLCKRPKGAAGSRALLQTCFKIRNEAWPVFFSRCAFSFAACPHRFGGLAILFSGIGENGEAGAAH